MTPDRVVDRGAGATRQTGERKAGTARFTRMLYVRQPAPARVLLRRGGLVVVALLLAVLIFWLERDNLRDASGGRVGLADVVYFTMVTITTVGYGDIVPVGENARLVDALAITPIRLFVWLMFLGTAYEFFWQRIVEEHRMKKLQQQLTGHIIVCGYGYSGSSAARLLAASEADPRVVVVIDLEADRLEEAAEHGLIGLRGDCTRDDTLKQAGITTAHAILFCIRRDEIAALGTLTARNLNPDIRILATVNDQENVQLLRRAGAQEVIAPSRLAGHLMADAVSSRYTTRFVADLLCGPNGFMRISERPAREAEVGRAWREVPHVLVVAVERAGAIIGFWEAGATRIEAGDLVFAIEANLDTPGRIELAPPL